MEMNQQNQVNNSVLPLGIPLKRKRGRPRKDQSQNPGKSTYTPRKKDPLQNHGENAPVPPGFEAANENQSQPAAVGNGNNEVSMIGQMVTGVIEASFDAGFLISVRVGESQTCLRGVVFKHGHYVPVSAENDVAPNLQMIQRNEVPFPNQGPQKRRGRAPRDPHASYPSNGSPSSSQLTLAKPGQLPMVVAQSPHPLVARGTVVPVILQPVNLSNGASPVLEAPPVASQPAHLAASKSKHGASAQPVQETMSKGSQSQTDSGSASQPFEELISVAKRMQGSPESVEAQNESAILSSANMLPKDPGTTPEQAEDFSKPLLVKPLQAIRSSLPDQPTPMPHAFPERRTGKMTELLLAVQENLMERQRAEGQHQDFKSPEN